jgi:hypothetical protein
MTWITTWRHQHRCTNSDNSYWGFLHLRRKRKEFLDEKDPLLPRYYFPKSFYIIPFRRCNRFRVLTISESQERLTIQDPLPAAIHRQYLRQNLAANLRFINPLQDCRRLNALPIVRIDICVPNNSLPIDQQRRRHRDLERIIAIPSHQIMPKRFESRTYWVRYGKHNPQLFSKLVSHVPKEQGTWARSFRGWHRGILRDQETPKFLSRR